MSKAAVAQRVESEAAVQADVFVFDHYAAGLEAVGDVNIRSLIMPELYLKAANSE